MSIAPRDILDFWFGEFDDYVEGDRVGFWFRKSDETDRTIRERFGESVRGALAGELDGWADTIENRLALVLLLDQFTRNIYRGTPRAFAGDVFANALALDAIDRGWDEELRPHERLFLYMPLEHQEDLHLQHLCVLKMRHVVDSVDDDHAEQFANFLDYAVAHRDVIEEFGRFPHRNAILKRPSSVAEREYLSRPGSGF